MQLVAYDIISDKVTIDQATRGGFYFCPGCGCDLIAKKGNLRAHHFAHKTKVPCVFRSCSESYDHLEMKQNVYRMLLSKHPNNTVILEESLNDYVADVMFYGDQPLVIECQASSLTQEQLLDKIEGYSVQRYYVLYIVHRKAISKHSRLHNDDEYRIPHWIRTLHTLHYGHIDVYEPEDKRILAIHLGAAYRCSDEYWDEDGVYHPALESMYSLKETRSIQIKNEVDFRSFKYENKARIGYGLPRRHYVAVAMPSTKPR